MAFWRTQEGKLNWACFIWFYAGCMMTLRGISEHGLVLGAASATAFAVSVGFALRRAWAAWLMLLLVVIMFVIALWLHSRQVFLNRRSDEFERKN